MIDKKLINGVINEELIDVELYIRESIVFKEKIIGGSRIAEKFKSFANDEKNHVRALQLIFKIEKIREPRVLPEYKSIRNVLRIHLIREEESIRLYKNIISNLTESKHIEMIKEILKQEEEHYKDIKNYLLKLI